MLNVTNVTGEVIIRLPNGEERPVVAGDVIPSDAEIIAENGGQIMTEELGSVVLSAGVPQRVESLENFTAATSDDEFVVYDDSLDDVLSMVDGGADADVDNASSEVDIDALLSGDGDILDALEETAAGLGGGGGGGGASFVQLSRIAEDVDPLAFEFEPTTGNEATLEDTDAAGNEADAEPTTLEDVVISGDFPPVVSGESNLAPDTPVTIIVTDENGTETTIDAPVAEDGSFTVTLPDTLEDGTFDIVVEAPDPQTGTVTFSDTFVVDTTAPTITVDPVDVTNDPFIEITGSSDLPAGSEVSVTIVDAAGNTQTVVAVVADDGSFSVVPDAPLAEGAFDISVSATDEAGNTTTVESSGEADFTPPTVTFDVTTTPGEPAVVNGNTDLAPGSTVTVTVTDANGDAFDLVADVQADGSFAATLPADLAEGDYTVSVEATDPAGNQTQTAGEFTVEADAPVAEETTEPTPPPAAEEETTTPPEEAGTTEPAPGEEEVTPGIEEPAPGEEAATPGTEEPAPGEEAATPGTEEPAPDTEAPDGTTEAETSPTLTIDPATPGNDATPTVSGTTDLPAGETVSITVTDANGDDQTFTATVQPDGSFSADVPADLAEGAYTVDVTATDAAGNTTTATDAGGEVDTSAPTVTVDPQNTGNDATPTVSGTTDLPAGETVSITVTDANGDAQTFTATVQPDGSFSADVPADLADGAYTVEATATDAAGNTTTATETGGEVNTAAPSLSLNPQSPDSDTTPTVSGTTDLPAGETVSITVTDANGDAQTFTATVQPDGTFSADVPTDLAEGAYTVEASATDASGNTATTTEAGGEVDTTAPTVTLDAQTTDNDATPTVSGSTDLPAGDTVSITVTDANGDAQTFTATVQPDGTFSADVPADLADGAYTVEATATDVAGNANTATDNNGEIDTAVPTVTLDAQTTGNDATPNVSGTTDLPLGETVSITVTDANGDAQTFTATVQPDGSFSADVPADLADGAYTVEATATDAAGNATTATDNNGEIDTAAPVITLDPHSLGNDATPTVSGTTDLPAGETVSITVTDSNGDAQTFTATVQPDGSFSADVPADMADGAYTVEATATDAAGNATTATDNNGEIDTAAPTITLDAQTTGNDATPTVSGTTDLPAGETVSITVTDANGDAQTFTATVQPDGSFSADVPADMADGAYTVEATATDDAGNATTATDNNGEIDTAAPTITLDAQTTGNDATPTVSGTTDLPVGETVSITVTDSNGDAQTFTATVQPDGSFSADVPADMADGAYTVEATATDAAGNATTAIDNNGEIDTAAPSVTLDAQTTGNDATPTVSGTTDLPGGETVSITVTDANGDAQTFTATVQPDGTFSADVPADMADGAYTVEATATDAAGNATTATDNNGEIDTAAPTITLDAQTTGNDATPTVSGTTDLPVGETVSITVTDANGDAQTFTTTVQPDGSFSADVPADMADGAYTVEATATDAAGNATTATDNNGEIDTAAPTVTLDPQNTGNDATPTVSGTTDLPTGETISITVTDANGDAQTFTATVQPDGSFSADVPADIAEGAYTVEATATDAAGNTTSTTDNGGVLNTAAPTLTLEPQSPDTDTTPTISGSTDLLAGDTVSITVTDANGDAQTFTATVQPDGTFSADVPTALAEGAYTVEATATDASGNTATTTEVGGEVDTTAPTVTLDAHTTGNDATPTVSGSTDLPVGETVSITVTDANGDAQTFTATVQPDGSFSADVPADMADGAYTVEATATDAAGNATTATDNNGEIDTAAPTITLDAQTIGNDATPTVSGSTDLPVGETVSITVTDANGDAQTFTATVQPDGSFSADVPADMADGAYTVEATATDAAGNATTATDNNGEIDTAAPTITLDAQTTGNDATPTVSGTTDLPAGETVSITVTDANGDAQTFTATVQPDGSFSADVPADMADGAYTVEATATDAAGNATTATDNNGEIDTAAPTIALDAQTTGNDATPTISGTTDLPAGETVSITVTDANGDAQTFTATVQPDGSFSADVPADMADGAYTVEATATDDAGNATTATDNNGEIDTAAPTITLDAQTTGNDATPTVSGTTDLPAGETVSITVTDANGDAQTFTATVQPDGSFSADVPADMADGAYTVEATATDAAGNATTATDNNGEIDTAAPTITLDAQTTGNDATPTVSGSTDLPVGETVSITVTDANGDAQTFTATVQPDGTFSADVPADMADGAYTVEATATDAAGNATTATDNNGEVDTSAPTVTLDPQNTANDATPTVSGTTDLPVGETVSITVTDSNGDAQTFTATVQPDGSFSADVPADMADGAYTVEATATDAAGNATTATDNNGEIDTAAPTITLDAQTTGNDATPTVSGTTDLPAGETVSITVTDANGDAQTFTATVQPDGSFSADVPADMADGAYTVEATVTDAAGNATTATDNNGEIDTSAPTITLDAQTIGNDATPTVSGTTDLPAGETVSITVTDANGDAQTFTATVQPDGSFSADVPADMADGAYTVEATATDAAGNATTATDNNGEIDTAAPTITLDAQTTGNDATPTVSGTTDLPAGETVSITVTDSNGDAQTFTATVQPDGSFSADVPADMADGAYTVEATATDAAGNATTATDNNGEIDTAAPTITLDAQTTGNDATPTVSGSTDLPVGETVSITVTDANGDAQTFTATVQPDGTFSADVPADMADGAYTVEATATDAAGNATTATDNNGEIDTAAPTITLDAQTTGNDATPTVSGTTDLPAGETVSITVTDSNGDAQTFTATVQPDGSFSADVPADMADGAYTVEATATDAAGNATTATDNNGEVDTSAPTVTLDPQNTANDATPTVSGTTDLPVGETVSITVTDANGDAQTFTATVQPDGSFSANVPADMADGAYTVEATATDAAGNATTATDNNGEIDTAAPTITLDAQTTGNDATPTVSGSTDLPVGETVSITVTDANGDAQTFTATVQPDGSFSADVPADMADGAYTVEATATDAAGNATTATDNNGEIDTAAPVITLDPHSLGNDATPTVSGTTDLPAGETVSITVTDANGDAQTFTATVQPDGSFSADVPADLADGAYTVEATATDAAGNSTTASDNNGEIDTTPPLLIIDPVGDTNDNSPTISGSADVGIGTIIIITVTDSNGVEYNLSAIVQADGSWSTDLPVLPDGSITVEAQVFDDAGNIVDVSVAGTIDTADPGLTLDAFATTNELRPTISGTSDEIGAVIEIVLLDGLGVQQNLTATVQPDGTWAVVVPADLNEGLLNIDVSVLDAAGNLATVSTSGLIDLTLPILNVNAITDLTSDTPLISGTSDEIGALITIVVTDGNGDAQSFTATVLGDGTWSANVPSAISEGLLDVNVSVLDAAGNLATVSTSGLIDLTLPILNVNAITDLTSDTPLISGTSDEIGALITIVVTDGNGDAQSFTATVLGDGTWSANVPSAISEGLLDVNVSVLDAAGNLATVSTSGLIDLTLPILNVNAITDLTSDTPLISGTSDEIGALITIVVTDGNGDAQSFTATVLGDGTWSANVPSAISEGLLDVNVSVLDAAGNLATVSTSGLIDLTLPILNVNAITDLTSDTPLISGTSDEIGALITIVVTDGNGDAQSFTATVLGDGTWSANVPSAISEGLLDVNVSVLDAAGNLATVSTSGLIDLTLPILNVNAITDLTSDTPLISGTSDEIGAIITIVVTDGNGDAQSFTATVLGDGTWSANVPSAISEGLLDVNVSVLDAAGNLATVSTSGLIDLTLPILNVNAITDLNSDTPLISGTSDELGALITIVVTDGNGDAQSFTATVLGDGTWSANVPSAISEGLLDVNVSVLDTAGNLATVSTSGLIDLTLPILNINPITDLISSTPLISGTSDEIGALVSIAITDGNGDAQSFTATVLGDGTWSANVPSAISEGLLDVNVSVLDGAGNLATVSTSGLIDLTLPILTVDAIGFTNDLTPTISGTSDEIGATVDILTEDASGNTQTLSTTVGSDGTYSLDIPADVAEGILNIDVSVIDVAGNLSELSVSGVVDVTPPALNITHMPSLTQPYISGTSDPELEGLAVNLDLTANILGIEATVEITVAIAEDGTWNYGPILNLGVGPVSLTASITDAAGNVSETTESGSISILGGFLSGPSSEPSGSEDSGSLLSINLGPLSIDI